MSSPESILLIHKAVHGDRKAWDTLCGKYYPLWWRRFHGEVGRDLRNICDTYDIIQSALGDAFRDAGALRNEGAFFAWTCAIMRRKIVDKRRKKGKAKATPLEAAPEPGKSPPSTEFAVVTEADYERLLDAIIDLYPGNQEEMAAIYLKYFERFKIEALQEALGASERTVHRILDRGLELLRGKIAPK